MNTDNTPKTDKISDETSAKLLRCHIEDASSPSRQSTGTEPAYQRGDDGTGQSVGCAMLILAVMLLVIWFSK